MSLFDMLHEPHELLVRSNTGIFFHLTFFKAQMPIELVFSISLTWLTLEHRSKARLIEVRGAPDPASREIEIAN